MPLAPEIVENLVHLLHGRVLGFQVHGADGRGTLEGHVLEDVGQARDALDLVHGADVRVGQDGEDGGVMVLHYDEGESVVEREFRDVLLEGGQVLGHRRAGQAGQAGQRKDRDHRWDESRQSCLHVNNLQGKPALWFGAMV